MVKEKREKDLEKRGTSRPDITEKIGEGDTRIFFSLWPTDLWLYWLCLNGLPWKRV
jgi:hypothetical protein